MWGGTVPRQSANLKPDLSGYLSDSQISSVAEAGSHESHEDCGVGWNSTQANSKPQPNISGYLSGNQISSVAEAGSHESHEDWE